MAVEQRNSEASSRGAHGAARDGITIRGTSSAGRDRAGLRPRKPASAVFTLDECVAAGSMTGGQASALRAAVTSRSNIPVVGGASTGTTFQMFMARPRGFEPLTPRSVVAGFSNVLNALSPLPHRYLPVSRRLAEAMLAAVKARARTPQRVSARSRRPSATCNQPDCSSGTDAGPRRPPIGRRVCGCEEARAAKRQQPACANLRTLSGPRSRTTHGAMTIAQKRDIPGGKPNSTRPTGSRVACILSATCCPATCASRKQRSIRLPWYTETPPAD